MFDKTLVLNWLMIRTMLGFSFLVSAIVTYPLAPTPAIAATTSGSIGPRVTQGLDDLKSFEQTHSIDELDAAIRSLFAGGGQTIARSSSPQDYVEGRRQIVDAYVQVFAAIQRLWDPRYNPNDTKQLPVTCVIPPGNGTLPCGVNPSAVKDPNARQLYVAEIAANKQKAQRFNFQTKLRYYYDGALVGLRMTLDSFRSEKAPPDAPALNDIVRRSTLSASTQESITALF